MIDKAIVEQVAANARGIIERAGISAPEAARRAGVPVAAVQRLVKAQGLPGALPLYRLALALDSAVGDFFAGCNF